MKKFSKLNEDLRVEGEIKVEIEFNISTSFANKIISLAVSIAGEEAVKEKGYKPLVQEVLQSYYDGQFGAGWTLSDELSVWIEDEASELIEDIFRS